MIKRQLDAALEASLLANEDVIYYNLVKFERPKASSNTGATANVATDYTYITDAPHNITWDDGSKDGAGTPNGAQLYYANKVISMGGVQESIEARASSMTLKLSSTALGVVYTGTISINSSGYIDTSIDLVELGFREGDKIQLLVGAANLNKFVRFDRFTAESASSLPNSRVYITDLSSPGVSTDSTTYTLALASEELTALTTSKEATLYSNYINREVFIYRAHTSPDTGDMIGEPFLLFKGIISQGSIQEKPDSDSTISWSLTSHWGDFVRVQGRSTSDSSHRALSMTGQSDPDALLRPEYASDYGFMHAERSVNALGQFQTKELRYKLVKSGGFLGLFKKKKLKEEYVDVTREVDLRFNLSATYLPVVYGVQKVPSIPVFADVDATDPTNVYVAYALCEGEIGGIFDVHIEDKPSVCIDAQDELSRGWNAAQVEDSNVDVICYGRADRGDVLSGVPYVDGTVTSNPYMNISDADYFISPSWARKQAGLNLTLPPQVTNIGVPKTDGTGAAPGLTHETTYRFDLPIDVDLVVHTGKADQSADQVLLNKALAQDFKIQQDFFDGDPANYWSPSHQLLDTAYVVGKFILSEGEETIPEYAFVVKGKYTECYNYDHSFKGFKGQTSHTNFNIGDTVTITASGGGGTKTHTGVQIIDKWTQYDKNGVPDIRFRWRTNYPYTGDTLVNLTGSSGNHTLVTMTGASTWEMFTHEHVEHAGNVTASPLAAVSGYSYTNNGGEGLLTLTLTNTALNTQLAAIVAAGHDKGYVSITTAPQHSFLVKDFTYPTLTLEAYSGAGGVLEQVDFTGAKVYLSNAVTTVSTGNTVVGNKVIVTRIVNSVKDTREKTIVAITGTTVFTNTPFDAKLVPGLTEAWGAITDTYEVGPANDERVSINPAIQTLDYITNKRYGKGLDYYDDLNYETFLESARLCDDRSKVTVVANSAPANGAIYTYSNGSGLVFQGKVVSSEAHAGKYAVQFDDVIGKLGYKWNNWRTYTAGDLVWGYGKVAVAPGGTLTKEAFLGLGSISTISLTKVGGGTLAVDVSDTLGGVTNNNTIVRAWSEADQAYSETGYTLHDSDDVKYWKYIGWDAPEQRYVTRHQMNQIIDTNVSLFDNVNSMLSQFNGVMRYANGKYELDIRTAAPTVFTDGIDRISEADIIGEIKLDDKGQKNAFNSIAANIVDPQNKFGARSISFFDSTYLKEDKGIPKQGNFSMPGISNYFTARTNIIQFLLESRYGLTISFTRDAKGYLSLAGKILAINYERFGWVDKLFRIETLTLQTDGLVAIVAYEHNDAAFLIDFSDRSFTDNDASGSGTSITPPTNLQATQDLRGEIELTWDNSASYNPSTHIIEVWNCEASMDINGNYITTVPDVYEGNEFTRATLYDSTVGKNYVQDGFGSKDLHVWYYWIRYVVPSRYDRRPNATSVYVPLSTTLGVEGRAISSITLDAITVIMDNDSHTFPVNTGTGQVYDYSNSGTKIWVFEGPDLLDYDASVYPPLNGTWQITDIAETNLDNVSPGDITEGDVTPNRYAIVADHSGLIGDSASITYHIEGNRFRGETISIYKTQTFSSARSGLDGDQGSDGVDAKAVKLTADNYVIIYDEFESNPNPSTNVILTATAQNIIDPWYKFIGQGFTDQTVFSSANTLSWPVPISYFTTPQTVQVFVSENDPSGPGNDVALAFDSISITAVHPGTDGSLGADGRSVRLTAGTHVFTYNTLGEEPQNPMPVLDAPLINQTWIRAWPYQYSDTPFFQFFIDDNPVQGPAEGVLYLYTAESSFANMPKKIEVEMRESDGLGGYGAVLARDQMTMMGLKEGAGSINVVFTNESHTIPVTNTGTFDFNGSHTEVRVYEGAELLTYDGDGIGPGSDPASPGTWDFVQITDINVIHGTITDYTDHVLIGPLQGWDETGDGNRDDPMIPSEFTASVTYEIHGKRLDGVPFSVEKQQSFSLSLGGIDGSIGSGAKLLKMSYSNIAFSYEGDGTTLIGPSKIDFAVDQQGSDSEVNWFTRFYNGVGPDYWENTASQTWLSYSTGLTTTLTEANYQNALVETGGLPVVIWARFTDDMLTYYIDHIAIQNLRQGVDSIIGQLDNPADIIPANSDGTGYDLTGTGGTFRVWKGTEEITTGNGVVYSYVGSNSYNGLTINIDTLTGVYYPSGTNWLGTAPVAFQLSATYGTTVIKQWYSVIRSIAGAVGANGSEGTDAYSVSLSAPDLTIVYNSDGTIKTPGTTLFTATDLSLIPPANPWFEFWVDGTLEQDSASNTYLLDPTPTTSAQLPLSVRVDMLDTTSPGGGVPIARDEVTLTALQLGSNAISASLSNDSHTIPTDPDGNNGIYTGSGTTLEVYEGPNALTYRTSVPGVGEWTFTPPPAGTGIDVGEISGANTTTAGIGLAGFALHGNMTSDVAAIVYSISGYNSKGEAFTLTKTQTFSKSKKGTTGSIGANGENSIVIINDNTAHTVSCDSAGNSWTTTIPNSGANIQVWEGNTALTYQQPGNSPTLVAGEWTLSASPTAIIVGSLIDGDGTDTANIGEHSNITGGTGVISAIITYTITGKRLVTGTAFGPITTTQTFSKSIAGDDGQNAKLVQLLVSPPIIRYDSGSPVPSSLTLTAVPTGYTDPYYQFSYSTNNGDSYTNFGAKNNTTTRTVPSTGVVLPPSSTSYIYKVTAYEGNTTNEPTSDIQPATGLQDGADAVFYYIKPIDGTAIKNSTGTLTIEAHKVTGGSDSILSSGSIQLYNPSNTALGYSETFNAASINNSIVITLKDGIGGTPLDTITLVDITDGGVVGYVTASNGLAFTKDKNGSWDPSTLSTILTAYFYRGGTLLNSRAITVTVNSTFGTITSSSAHGSTASNITLYLNGSSSQAMTCTFTYSAGGLTSTVAEAVVASIAGTDGAQGDPGSAGITGVIEANPTLAWTQAPNSGAWSPSNTTSLLTSRFYKAGTEIGSYSRTVTRSNSLLTGQTGSFSNITASIVSGNNSPALTMKFVYSSGGETCSVSTTLTTTVGGTDGANSIDMGIVGSTHIALMENDGITFAYTPLYDINSGNYAVVDSSGAGLQGRIAVYSGGVNVTTSATYTWVNSISGGSITNTTSTYGAVSVKYATYGDIRGTVYTGSGYQGLFFFMCPSTGIWDSSDQAPFFLQVSYGGRTNIFPISLTKATKGSLT